MSFLPYTSVPLVFTKSPALFGSFWLAARTALRRIAVIGTSIQTSPDGAGAPAFQNIQAALTMAYGNMPESELISVLQGATAYFCAEGLNGGSLSGTQSAFTSSQIPPNMQISCTKQAADAGIAAVFSPTWQVGVQSDSQFPMNPLNWMDPANLWIRWYLCSFGGSGTNWVCHNIPWNLSDNQFYATSSLDTPVSLPGLNSTTPAILTATQQCSIGIKTGVSMVLDPYTAASAKTIAVLGARFYNPTKQYGVVLNSLSQGGLSSDYFLSGYANCQYIMGQLGYSAYLLMSHCNDPGNGKTTDFSYGNLSSQLTFLRAVHTTYGLPAPVFFVASDTPRSTDGSYPDRQFTSGIGYQLALNNPDVCAINLYAAAVNMGWTIAAASNANLTSDGTHPTADGARWFGRSMASMMLESADMVPPKRPLRARGRW